MRMPWVTDEEFSSQSQQSRGFTGFPATSKVRGFQNQAQVGRTYEDQDRTVEVMEGGGRRIITKKTVVREVQETSSSSMVQTSSSSTFQVRTDEGSSTLNNAIVESTDEVEDIQDEEEDMIVDDEEDVSGMYPEICFALLFPPNQSPFFLDPVTFQ